jgi:16S rRNA (guanine(527)-N(7))-methyltransferase RsmG
MNLTSVDTLEKAVLRHYCESLALGSHLPPHPVTVVDIGSGAGFPGIPIAILRPDCQVALVESHRRKAVFLREATRDYSNVRVIAERAESLHMRFDWLVSRALQWKRLLPLVRLAEHIGLLIGESDAAEIAGMSGVEWLAPARLPWSDQSMILIGHVPRGT